MMEINTDLGEFRQLGSVKAQSFCSLSEMHVRTVGRKFNQMLHATSWSETHYRLKNMLKIGIYCLLIYERDKLLVSSLVEQ